MASSTRLCTTAFWLLLPLFSVTPAERALGTEDVRAPTTQKVHLKVMPSYGAATAVPPIWKEMPSFDRNAMLQVVGPASTSKDLRGLISVDIEPGEDMDPARRLR